jgi:hypothetical protein
VCVCLRRAEGRPSLGVQSSPVRPSVRPKGLLFVPSEVFQLNSVVMMQISLRQRGREKNERTWSLRTLPRRDKALAAASSFSSPPQVPGPVHYAPNRFPFPPSQRRPRMKDAEKLTVTKKKDAVKARDPPPTDRTQDNNSHLRQPNSTRIPPPSPSPMPFPPPPNPG